MKATGIVRKIDLLGRLVLPMELRRTLEISIKDPVEIYVDDDMIVLKKYEPSALTEAEKAIEALRREAGESNYVMSKVDELEEILRRKKGNA